MLLGQLPDIPEAAVSNLDLLLRWAVLRMCDGNTQCLLKVLEMCKALLELCQQMVGGSALQARLLAHMFRLLQQIGSSVLSCWQPCPVCLTAASAVPPAWAHGMCICAGRQTLVCLTVASSVSACLGPWQACLVCLHAQRWSCAGRSAL